MAQLYLQVLGSFEAQVDGRAITHFRTDKMRALLAYLAMNGDRPFRREILSALLWPDWPDDDARRNLRQTLHRLRQMLNERNPAVGEDLLTMTRQTVQLNSTAVALDVARFQQHLHFCDTHYHERLQQCQECLKHMQQAAVLYRGELLAGFSIKDAFPFEEWLFMQREQLQQQMLELLDNLALAFEQQGEYTQAQRYAAQQVLIAPWQESAHRQLMRLYMLQGQRGAALAQYESCRQMLAQELDVEPAPETVQLWQQIKEDAFQQTAVAHTQTRNFPTQFTPFTGREQEIAQIMAALADKSCRILSLIGSGGTGKTRLSIQVGHVLGQSKLVYRDGAYFIPLAGVSEVDLLVTTVAQNLGIQLTEHIPPPQQLLTFLQDKELLLVLDNFEQILPAAPLLAEIAANAPQVQILLTSREPLNIQAEWRQAVGGLDYSTGGDPEALQFFRRSARRVAPQFEFSPVEKAAVRELCRLVDGLPLALEIAAAWVRMMDCPTILRETKKSIDFLSSPLSDVPPRHRSIRAVLSQSWHQLTPHLQNVLQQTGMFAGSFTLAAVLEIVPAVSLLDMATLLDKSLLHWLPNGRYEMHELLRQFVRSRSQAHMEQENYGRYYLNFAGDQEAQLRGPDPQRGIEAFQQDLDNVRQAWQWALESQMGAALLRGLRGLARFYHLAGFFQEAEKRFIAAVAVVEGWEDSPETSRLRGELHWQCSHFLGQSGQYEKALEHARRAQSVAQENKDISLLAVATSLEGEWYRHLGRYELARAFLDKALPLFPQPQRSPYYAKTLSEIGFVQFKQSRYDEALSSFMQARDIYETLNERTEISTTLGNIGYVYQLKAEYQTAVAYIREALEIAQTTGYKKGIVRHSISLSSVYMDQGDIDLARTMVEEALKIATILGYLRGIINCTIQLGATYAAQGQYVEAEQWYHRARLQAQEMDLQDLIALVVGRQGIIMAHRGDHAGAIAAYEEAVQLWRALENQAELGRNLSNLGNIYLRLGDYGRAEAYYEEALAAVQSAGARQAVANVLVKLGNVYKRLGRYDQAASIFEQALTLYRQLDLKPGIAVSSGWLGILHYEQGQFAAAREKYVFARRLCEEMGDKLSTAVWLTNLGDVAIAEGDYDLAWDYSQQAIALIRVVGSGRYLAEGLVKQALIRFEQGRLEQARLLLAEGIQIGEPIGDQQVMFDAYVLQARLADALGERETAVGQLQTLLPDFNKEEYQAALYFYLWQMSAVERYRETAVRLYQKLLAVTPNYFYRQRLELLL